MAFPTGTIARGTGNAGKSDDKCMMLWLVYRHPRMSSLFFSTAGGQPNNNFLEMFSNSVPQ